MTNKKNNDWQHLMEMYLADNISREDLEDLLQKANKGEDTEALTAALKEYWEKAKEKNDDGQTDPIAIGWDAKFESLMEEVKEKAPVVRMRVMNRKNWLYRVAAAVVVILILGAGSYFLFFNKDKQEIAGTNTQEISLKNDILPGTEGAILTLANGKQIILDSAGNGMLAIEGNTKVINKDGQITYEGETGAPNSILYNTMTTPKGRQYQLLLADGSKVWLNSVSSIRYPAAFTGKERKVEVTGEVYFEVAKDASSPFKVFVNSGSADRGMEVEVLGTHFNINSYADEAKIQTTLLEGSVKIVKNKNVRMLIPGQQAQVKNASPDEGIKVVKDVDVDRIMAWKNGYFSFDQTDLGTVMRQISRWYDVEIVYEGELPDRRFGGDISRKDNLSQVLRILEEIKVKFRIEGKKVIVQP